MILVFIRRVRVKHTIRTRRIAAFISKYLYNIILKQLTVYYCIVPTQIDSVNNRHTRCSLKFYSFSHKNGKKTISLRNLKLKMYVVIKKIKILKKSLRYYFIQNVVL